MEKPHPATMKTISESRYAAPHDPRAQCLCNVAGVDPQCVHHGIHGIDKSVPCWCKTP